MNAANGVQDTRSDIAMAPNGDYVVVWQQDSATVSDIYFKRYNAAGVAQGSEALVTPPPLKNSAARK